MLAAGLGLLGFFGYDYYQLNMAPNVPGKLSNAVLLIPTGASYPQVLDSLRKNGMLIQEGSFEKAAGKMGYNKPEVRSGRFEIKSGWSNKQLIRHLQIGSQAPVKVVLNNERLPENVAAKVARFLEMDSLAFMKAFQDTQLLSKMNYNPETLMSLFIPNTYQMYWNTPPEQFLERMKEENLKFWAKDGRMEKALALDMTPEEVYTLASIVEKETNQNQEKKRMAGVYLNRLKIGMRLQADPTCVFATRDFTTKRVTNYHLEFDSPYNTYIYAGLPPGPIAMASIASIDAVLNAEEHDYFYFVAKGDASGLHMYAQTLAGHNQNIAVYKANLRKFNSGR